MDFQGRLVKPATVNAETVFVNKISDTGKPLGNVPGTVHFDRSTNAARFIPNEPFVPGQKYLLTVRGDTPERVIDIDGVDLDGTATGEPRGNFTKEFTIAPDGG